MPFQENIEPRKIIKKQLAFDVDRRVVDTGQFGSFREDELLFSQTTHTDRFDELGAAVKTLFDIMPTAAEDVDNLPFGIASFEQGDELATGVRTLFDLYRVIEPGTNITITDNGYSIRIDSASGATSNPTTVNNAANPSGSATITSGNTTIGYTVKRFTAGTAMAIVNNTDDLVFNHSDRSNASEVVGNRLSSTAGKYISSIRRDALGHVVGISESDFPTGGGGGGTTTTLGNQGVGNLLVTGSAPAYGIKSIAAGSNVSITESGNTLYINASGGSGGSGGGEVVSASNTATINMTKTGTVLTADIRPHTTNDRKVLQSVSGVVSWGDDNVGSGGTTYTAGNLISLTGNAIAVSGSLTTSRTGTGVVTGTINLSAGTFSLDATVPPPSGGGLSNVTGTDPIVVTDASAGVKNVAVNTFSTTQAGVVPASGSRTKVLRGNGWQDFPTIPDAYVHPTFVPTGPQGGGDRTVRISRDNQGHIETIQDVAITFPVTSVNEMTGAVVIPPYTHPDSGVTVGSAGTSTRVPTLSVNAQGHVTSLSEIDIALPKLYGASDNKSAGNTVNNRGLVPSGSASGTKYLREDGQWADTPANSTSGYGTSLIKSGNTLKSITVNPANVLLQISEVSDTIEIGAKTAEANHTKYYRGDGTFQTLTYDILGEIPTQHLPIRRLGGFFTDNTVIYHNGNVFPVAVFPHKIGNHVVNLLGTATNFPSPDGNTPYDVLFPNANWVKY